MATALVISSIIFGYFIYVGLSNVGVGLTNVSVAIKSLNKDNK